MKNTNKTTIIGGGKIPFCDEMVIDVMIDGKVITLTESQLINQSGVTKKAVDAILESRYLPVH